MSRSLIILTPDPRTSIYIKGIPDSYGTNTVQINHRLREYLYSTDLIHHALRDIEKIFVYPNLSECRAAYIIFKNNMICDRVLNGISKLEAPFTVYPYYQNALYAYPLRNLNKDQLSLACRSYATTILSVQETADWTFRINIMEPVTLLMIDQVQKLFDDRTFYSKRMNARVQIQRYLSGRDRDHYNRVHKYKYITPLDVQQYCDVSMIKIAWPLPAVKKNKTTILPMCEWIVD
jgi:hypothetical protein